MQYNIENCDDSKKDLAKNEVEIKEEIECNELIKKEYVETIPSYNDNKSDYIRYTNFNFKNEDIDLKLECDDVDQLTHGCEKVDVAEHISTDKFYMNSTSKEEDCEIEIKEEKLLEWEVDSTTNQTKQSVMCSSRGNNENEDDYKHIFGANKFIKLNLDDDIAKKRFSMQNRLKHNVKNNSQVFKCHLCTYETCHKKNLTKHLKSHKNFECTLCSTTFTRKINLDNHSLRIHKCRNVRRKIYNCDQCSCEYLMKHALLKHKIKHGVTDGIPVLKCYQCTFQTYRKEVFMRHLKIHQNIKDFKCTYCSREFTQKNNLESHLLRIHKYRDVGKKLKLYNCDQCNCNYLSKRDLLQHKVKHGITDDIPIFKCYHCTFETYRKSSLISHVKIHQNMKYFKCNYCLKEFAQKSNLENHLLRIHKCRGATKKLYNCDHCSYAALGKQQLLVHKLTHGIKGDLEILKCPQCTFETYHTSSLVRHVKIHENIKDFKCTYCSNEFTQKHMLERHLLRIHKHRDVTKNIYNCDHCNYETLRKRELLVHKLKHGIKDGIQMFKCHQCTFESYRKSSLSRHVKIHKNIKDFKCAVCSKAFAEKRTLNNHLLKIHSEKSVLKNPSK